MTGVSGAQILSGRRERVKDQGSLVHRHVEFPSQFADISDAHRANGRVAQADGFGPEERKSRMRKVCVGEAAEQRARTRAHYAKNAVSVRHVHKLDSFARSNVPSNPVEIAHGL